MVIRYLTLFIACLNSLFLSAQIKFVAQEGLSGSIEAAYTDSNSVLHVISEDQYLHYYYAFDLKSNRIVHKLLLGKIPGRISYSTQLGGFCFDALHGSNDSCGFFGLNQRIISKVKAPPDAYKEDSAPASVIEKDYIEVSSYGKKGTKYFTGVNRLNWLMHLADAQYIYAISQLNQLYVFDHTRKKLLFIRDLGIKITSMLLSEDRNHLVLSTINSVAVFDLRKRSLINIIKSQKLNIKRLSYSNANGILSYQTDEYSGTLTFTNDGYANIVLPKDEIQTEIDNLKFVLKGRYLYVNREGIENTSRKIKIVHYKDLTVSQTTLEVIKSPDGSFYLLNLRCGLYDQLFFITNKGSELHIQDLENTYYVITKAPSYLLLSDRAVVSERPEILNNNCFSWKNEPFLVSSGKVYRVRTVKKDSLSMQLSLLKERMNEMIDRFAAGHKAVNHYINEGWILTRNDDVYGLLDYRDSQFFTVADVKTSETRDVAYNRTKKQLFYISKDGLIRVFDLKKQRTTGIILIDAAGGVIFQTQEGNIFSSSKEIRSITVNKNGIGDLHDYISYLNDPQVLKEFGLFSESFYQLHVNARERLGHKNNDSIIASIEDPPAVFYSVNSGVLSLTYGSKYPSRVVLNGQEILRSDKNGMVKTDLRLNEGFNKLKVYTYKNDIAGIPFTLNVENINVSNPAIIFAGFGVNTYKSTAFTPLRYAVKDVKDMSDLFGRKGKSYTYANQSCTRDSFLALKNKLSAAREDDIVVIHLSGHGILDRQGKFYFCTYDMDTSNPAKYGLSVEDISSVFENCRSRKRLVIIDACHSGFIDRTLFTTDTSSSDSVILAQKGASSTKLNTANIESDPAFKAFKLMLEAYPTFDLYTGINMMAAAAGYEYALEMSEWQNGALTYCIKEALLRKAADVNGDKEISIEELKDYIVRRVPVLTQGSQSPDFRLENLEYNWLIW